MNVLATVQGKEVWIYDLEWEILANIAKKPGARVGEVLARDTVVHERALQRLVDRGWVYYDRDLNKPQPLAGPKVRLTREGETAVKTSIEWLEKVLGVKKKR